MKKILLSTAFVFLLLSCEQEYLIPANEVPKWLRERIAEDEATIKEDPKLMANYGAWIRYEFNNEKYYEYDNPLSSLSRNPYSETGVRINTLEEPFTEYWNQKCCEKYVWKAPNYNKY
jgi:hypothetical protein